MTLDLSPGKRPLALPVLRHDAPPTVADQVFDVLHARILSLEADLAKAETGASESAKKQIRELKSELAETADSLAEVKTALSAQQRKSEAVEQERDLLKAENAKVTARVMSLGAINRDLEKKIAGLEKDLAELTRKGGADSVSDKAQDNSKPADDGQTQPSTAGRDPDAVSRAIDRVPGSDRYSASQRRALQSALERGGCVTDPLRDIFGKVSPLALITLMHELDSDC